MLYDPEMMRNIAAQKHEDRVRAVEKERLLKEIKAEELPKVNLTGIVRAMIVRLKPNTTVLCSECQVMVSSTKS